LEQNRPELRPEGPSAAEEPLDRFLRILQLLDVREVAAHLGGHHEVGWRSLAPLRKGLLLRERVEGVVQLDDLKTLAVELEPLRLSYAFGIEGVTPVAVLPPRRADEGGHYVALPASAF
jgi:hypothetical protein